MDKVHLMGTFAGGQILVYTDFRKEFVLEPLGHGPLFPCGACLDLMALDIAVCKISLLSYGRCLFETGKGSQVGVIVNSSHAVSMLSRLVSSLE